MSKEKAKAYDVKLEPKGSMGSTYTPSPDIRKLKLDVEENYLNLLEILNDIDTRLYMIERKLCFLRLPKIESIESDYDSEGDTD
tara:strand:+ start:592 stop:843 length:252 start_codon:yes stop_codon:yes gene_type:complete